MTKDELITLREFLEARLEHIEEKTRLATAALDKRLEGMNEFRDTLKDQASRFVTRTDLEVILEKNLTASCPGKSALFRNELDHPGISQIRGEGLLMAIRLDKPEYVRNAVTHAPDFGLILDYFLFCDDAFRIAPPLTISNEEIVIACRQIKLLLDMIMKNPGTA